MAYNEGSATESHLQPNMAAIRKIKILLSKTVAVFSFQNRYNPRRYWKKRHRKFGFNLRGVGNCSLSAEQNEQEYLRAKDIFLNICKSEGVDFKKARILDIGCGTGFYADVIRSQGGKDYLGIDITDQLFPALRKKYPDFSFQQADVSEAALNQKFDLIVMIDVTQHIVGEAAFSNAMQNIKSCLSPNGVFIVTSWLSKEFRQRMFYEVERPIVYYKKEFPDYLFSKPMHFRDKYIFSVR